MAALIDRIKESTDTRARAVVPEWGDNGEPCIIYALPLSVGDIARVQRKHPDFLNTYSAAGMIDLIIRKCQDEGGKKVFTLEDRATLMAHCSLDTIGSLFSDLWGEINKADRDDADDPDAAKKN